MTLQTLPTKLYTPTPNPNLVTRPRLLRHLDSGISGIFTLVSAPAGYGKSTLLSEWVHSIGIPAAWLSLDHADSDPVRFWVHFVAALQSIPMMQEFHVGEKAISLLGDAGSQVDQTLYNSLITDLAAIPVPFLLVLDDFHLVTEVEILDGLYFLLEHLPPGMSGFHLVVSTRADPPWPMARLRVGGQITEIRARDLRFTHGEATQFLNQVMGMELPSDAVHKLDQRTEGWVAGLQMAALALGGSGSAEGQAEINRFLEGFTGGHRFVLDYLVEEVLNRLPPEHLVFLLKTAILERLNGSLSAAVTGDTASHEILLQLEKANLFLVPLDDDRNWYRYHHLFADLLRKQLQFRHPDLIPDLHCSASRWYAQVGDGFSAVDHAIKTRDWSFAANQIETHILPLIQRGEVVLARSWISALPEDVIRSHPVLCVAQAWTSAKFATAELAEELLIQAESALLSHPTRECSLDPDVQKWVSSQIAVLQVVIARVRGDSTQRQLSLALEALDRVGTSRDTAAQATLFFRLGLCYLDLCKHAQADRTFIQAVELGRVSGNHYAFHAASYGRMVIARLNGQLHALEEICQQALSSIKGIGGEGGESLVGIAMVMAGALDYEWNHLEVAGRDLTRGLEKVEQLGVTELLIKGRYAFACLQLALGKLDSSPDLVTLAEQSHPRLGSFAAALQARIDLLRAQHAGDQQSGRKAKQWAGRQQLRINAQSTFDWEIQAILVYVRVLCWDDQIHQMVDEKTKLQESLDFISAQRQLLDDAGWVGTLVELDVVSAIVLQTLDRNREALKALERALTLAAPQNFVRTFVDEGKIMRSLLQQTITQGTCPAQIQVYARELLSAFEGETIPSQFYGTGLAGGLVDRLSEREHQVLHLLNSKLSVPEIADELHLAPTTVRTHIQHIYNKLSVHGRIEALQRAEQLGLL